MKGIAGVEEVTSMLAVCLTAWGVLVSAGHQPTAAWLEACCCRKQQGAAAASRLHEGRGE